MTPRQQLAFAKPHHGAVVNGVGNGAHGTFGWVGMMEIGTHTYLN